MSQKYSPVVLDLIAKYFNDESSHLTLKDGEALIVEGDYNESLYFHIEGKFLCVAKEHCKDGQHIHFCKGDFIGIQSFLDENHVAFSTVTSIGKSIVSHVKYSTIEKELQKDIYRIFSPIYQHCLQARIETLYSVMEMNRVNQKQMAEIDRLSFLGQFSAGVAHELNNAITTVCRGSEWLVSTVKDIVISSQEDSRIDAFQKGLSKGRSLSSKEVRENTKQLQQEFKLSSGNAKIIAKMGFDGKIADSIKNESDSNIRNSGLYWELGVTLKDVSVAAIQAGNVVDSMKNLGARHSKLAESVDVVQSIRDACSILRGLINEIDIKILAPEKPIFLLGNKGEMIQVWTNLIKNACEAIHESDNTSSPQITIELEIIQDSLKIFFKDNGPGIPLELISKIFQPNFSTKHEGLSFGLGLGLSLVQKIIREYQGSLTVENIANGALFTVTLPFNEDNK